jgi:hypothetical protein
MAKRRKATVPREEVARIRQGIADLYERDIEFHLSRASSVSDSFSRADHRARANYRLEQAREVRCGRLDKIISGTWMPEPVKK